MKLAMTLLIAGLASLAAAADDAPVGTDLRAAYVALPGVKLDATYKLETKRNDKVETQTGTLTSTFARRDEFRHEMKDDVALIAGKQKLYRYDVRRNQYWKDEFKALKEGQSPPMSSTVAQLVRQQNPVLYMLVAGDADHPLGPDATNAKVDGIDITFDRDGAAVRFAIDPATKFVNRVTVDLSAAVTKMGGEGISSAVVQIDYTTTPGTADAKTFAFTPPAGSVMMTEMRVVEDESADKHSSLGKAAPEIALKGLDEVEVTTADLKGSVVVLDFWATWCGPCKAGLPFLDKTYQAFKEKGVKAYAVNVQEEAGPVKKFVDSTKLGVPVLLDADGKTSEAFGVNGIPHQVVIGKDGVVKTVIIGFSEDEVNVLRAAIEKALAE